MCQDFVKPLLVEADDYLIADHDDRHAHLAGLVNHFPGFFAVFADIVIGKFDSLFRKILFRSVTPGSGLS